MCTSRYVYVSNTVQLYIEWSYFLGVVKCLQSTFSNFLYIKKENLKIYQFHKIPLRNTIRSLYIQVYSIRFVNISKLCWDLNYYDPWAKVKTFIFFIKNGLFYLNINRTKCYNFTLQRELFCHSIIIGFSLKNILF